MAWDSVEFLETGDSFYQSVLTAIEAARVSVLVEMYIFRCDKTGMKILDALCAAKNRAVRVFLRVDGVGSRESFPVLHEFCTINNLELEIFHPLPFASSAERHAGGFFPFRDSFLNRWKSMNHRSHRKLVIVDEQVAFSGGRNVDDVESESYFGASAWHDLTLRLEGSSLRDLARAFWFRPFRNQPSPDFLLNYNWHLKLSRNTWFSHQLQESRDRCWVITPYFAPTPSMLFQLRRAAHRGVDVRLILPTKTDVQISQLAAHALYHRLLAWGVRIFEFEPRILHRKLWILDDKCVVGSGNLNHRSFMHDLELDVVLSGPERVARGAELFQKDQLLSHEVLKSELNHLPPFKRVLYWLASWLVYWL